VTTLVDSVTHFPGECFYRLLWHRNYF